MSGRGIIATRDHFMAFDGHLLMDTLSPRLTWAADHPCANQRALIIVTLLEREPERP